LYLWRAVLGASTSLQGFDWEQMKAYLLLAFVSHTLVSWWGEWRIAMRIIDGTVATDLVKPVDFQRARLAEVMGAGVVEAILSAVVVAGALLVFASVATPHGWRWALFAVSFAAAIPLKFALVYVTTLLCFWTTGYLGITWARIAITDLLSGALIPLVFFPQWLRGLAMVLPFQGVVSSPALIYLEHVDSGRALELIAIQIAWIVGLWMLGRLMWHRGVRQVTIHGG
jgi:ABC-2 type transport system permease protein